MYDKKIVLASGSPRRKEILSSLKIDFDTIVSDVEENFDTKLLPHEVVEYLALLKAREVVNKCNEPSIIIGADTVIYFKDRILGKPNDEKDAKEMLIELRGKEHLVATGVAIIDSLTQKVKVMHSIARVVMCDYSLEEINNYVDTGEPMDKAGGYAIQGEGRNLIARYEGCYTGIIGLPICKMVESFQEFGVDMNTNISACKLDSGELCPELKL